MKKILTLAALAIAGATSFTAQAEAAGELVATLHSGDAVTVNWENPMRFDADRFADVTQGMYIYISLETADGEGNPIELHDRMEGSFTFLPGTVETFLGAGSHEYRYYITPAGLKMLKAEGMEICGKNFEVKSAAVYNDGYRMADDAVWGGYFWVDSWNTLNLYATAFKVDYEYSYAEFAFAPGEVTATDYVINFMTAFDDPSAVIGNTANGDFTCGTSDAYMCVDNAAVNAKTEGKNVVFCQFDKGGNNPFNMVGLRLTKTLPTTGASNIMPGMESDTRVFNLQGIYVGDSLDTLPAGMYIRGGKKVFKSRF